ncbi:hypothetical protein DEJ25_09585 [Curtobacterium sp. MCPF17_011]|uniref:hypothetical protein n=1 Tax=Curtobacterium sp. MCPF17_011 TaxID=2175652 RepID=UPI000DA97F2A|nr:hypothetical protein [Curtobacterium sp. MCPF17_011]PZF12070.1 hypothetical protein DEJ25_09585 [Curtobacterium sp. MCPF17_011]
MTTPMKHRPEQVPNYLTDLGVRTSPEPAQFFSLAQVQLGADPIVEDPLGDAAPFAARWDSGEVSEQGAIAELDAVVSIAGFWSTAAEMAEELLSSRRRPAMARLRGWLGSALASRRTALAEVSFRSVGSAFDTTPDVIAAAHIRIAAMRIKRDRDTGGGVAALAELDVLLERWVGENLMSDGDGNAMRATARNLHALACSMNGELERARGLLGVAAREARTGDLVSVEPDQRARYAAQIDLNAVQVAAMSDGWSAALEGALTHVQNVSQAHRGSLPEALSYAAYVAYRASDFPRAASCAERAVVMLGGEGAPLRLSSARKILAAALDAAGRTAAAQRVIERHGEDPLGASAHRSGAELD